MTNDKIDELIEVLTVDDGDWVEINSSGARKAVEAIKQLRKERDGLRGALDNIRTHCEITTPNQYKWLSAWNIANEALKKAGEHDS